MSPDLADGRLATPDLARSLARSRADPSITPSARPTARVPALELAPREIAALVAFVNAERAVSTR